MKKVPSNVIAIVFSIAKVTPIRLKRHTLSDRTDVKQTIVTRTVCVSPPNMARTPTARAAVFQEWAESKIRHHASGAPLVVC